MNDKVPPSNIEIEQAILGVYLTYPDTQETILSSLEPYDFHSPRHLSIYKYIYNYIDLIKSNDKVVDGLVFLDYLSRQNGALKACGGEEYVRDLMMNAGISVGYESHIKTLKELSLRRNILDQCYSIIKSCYDDYSTEIGDIIGDVKILLESSKQTKYRNLAQEVKDLIDNNNGKITTTFVHNSLQLSTRNDKKNVSTILKRLEADGYIERTGVKAGEYRILEPDIEYDDWYHSTGKPIDVKLPFGMERIVELFPGSIIVLAGETNAGKSALCFEFMRLNMHNFEIVYHSSEIGMHKFKHRLSLHEDKDLDFFKKVLFKDGLTLENAAGRTKKNYFNIYDYLEPTEGEYFKIPSSMRDIHQKLGDGIGLICLQKDKGAQWPNGGPKTLQKASLACYLEEDRPGDRLIVKKCKEYKGETNPRDWGLRYKIVKGINLRPEGIFGPTAISWRE